MSEGQQPIEKFFAFEIDVHTGEASAHPTPEFFNYTALWRVDILKDLVEDLEVYRDEALTDWRREMRAKGAI